MEKTPEQFRKKEKLSTFAMAAIAVISMFVATSCKVMLPNGRVMTYLEYKKKRDAARKKCEHLLPKHLKNADFDDIYCNPCTRKFKSCIDKTLK